MQLRNLVGDLQSVNPTRLVHRHRVLNNPIHSGVTNVMILAISSSPSLLPPLLPSLLLSRIFSYEPFFYEYPPHLPFLGTHCKEYTKSQVLFHIAVLEVHLAVLEVHLEVHLPQSPHLLISLTLYRINFLKYIINIHLSPTIPVTQINQSGHY